MRFFGVSSASFLSIGPHLVTAGFSQSEQLLVCDFFFAVAVKEAPVGRVRGSGKERNRRLGDQTQRRRKEAEKRFPRSSGACLPDPSGRGEA